MLGKKYEDRTIFDHTDEFCNFMENCHGDRELGRKWYLVEKEGREYLELWSEQWGGRVRLATRPVMNRFVDNGMDYIMIDEPENGHKSLVFRYKNPLFSKRITLYDIEDGLMQELNSKYAPKM